VLWPPKPGNGQRREDRWNGSPRAVIWRRRRIGQRIVALGSSVVTFVCGTMFSPPALARIVSAM
jgi:hypothetical protein